MQHQNEVDPQRVCAEAAFLYAFSLDPTIKK